MERLLDEKGYDVISKTERAGGGGSNYGNGVMLEHISFGTDNGYEIEVYTRGGKIMNYMERRHEYDEDKQYKKPVINTTRK